MREININARIQCAECGHYEQLSEVVAGDEGVFFRQAIIDELVEKLIRSR